MGTSPPPKGCCGAYAAFYNYMVPGKHCSGWLVQRITKKYRAFTCKGELEVDDTLVFYEAWHYSKNKPLDDNYKNFTDASVQRAVAPASGNTDVTGIARFFCDDVADSAIKGWIGGRCTSHVGGLPCTDVEPVFWKKTQAPGQKEAKRTAKSKWCCCPDTKKKESSVTSATPGKASKPACK